MDVGAVKIGVVGAGSWGTALADLLGLKGFKVDLWVFEKEVKEQIQDYRENKVFLPGFSLSANIFPSNDISEVVSKKDLVLIVVPSHVMRETAQNIRGHISTGTIIVSASKGIENKTHLTMSGVLKETLPEITDNFFAVLSGPSFAREVANKFPTVISVGSKDQKIAGYIQHLFATPYFRVYTNNDIIGLELGGAVKNVIAIAAGIMDGLGLGLNTRAALITRGLTEMRRLGLKLGADPRTFAGIAGIGDLVLTCTGNISRNHTVGKKIGGGMKLKEILSEMRMVAEGVKTAKSVYNLSRRLGVEMPISNEVYHILYDDVSPREALHRLMTRDLKHELDIN
ncbi:MAG: NAD(P)-dependent glycerol-3-phosphate dehydrogenase [Deltaproteobacteria bacterium]|nr:NAD(P)-dependent glycerol-3-phosphate dehydrogenase [Deltaproteobacteria bacterium]MBW2013045.1 NAD(P)-dependent glycerol-3-phosphate dehydrogenase [Deltaproteobacteria bacterium]MBW2089281.1 NAD(P)-dependent glycerol-3-phosphate dehydrogenase [Deltaproteobacteria bacterium]MBW2320860.1 NAD(P)-dependent glycerol-3-phosphate dehydrogenase [Deltaproteobacteria bacterium]